MTTPPGNWAIILTLRKALTAPTHPKRREMHRKPTQRTLILRRLLGFIRELAELTKSEDLHKSLFQIWRYDDDKSSLRWNPQDDRRYALRWSGDPIKTMRAANRLAVEALPLLPVMPRAASLETTGFVTRGSRGTYWTWPLWEGPIGLDVVRSLLSDRRLRKEIDDRLLARSGIAAVFRSQRVTIGKYRNFTAGVPV